MVLHHSIKLDPASPGIQKLNFDINQHMKFWAPQSYQDHIKGKNTPFYVGGGILGPMLAVPWYAFSLALNTEPTHFVPFFTNSVIITFTSLILFVLSGIFFSSRRIAFVLSLAFSLTSFVWPYNTSFFLQPAQALMLISSLYFIILSIKNESKRYSLLGGIFLGLSVLVHPSSLIFIPGFLAFSIIKLRKSRKNLLSYLTVMILTTSIQFVSNYLKYGSVTDFGYGGFETAAVHNDLIGLIGLLFSPGWGLIFYFPLTVLLPSAFHKIYKNDKILFCLCTYVFTLIWLFFGTETSPSWSGFGGWGPRYFIPFLPFASFSLGYLLINLPKRSVLKISFIGLAVCGFIVNLLGSLVWYLTAYGYGWSIEKLITKQNSFDYFAWIPQYSPILEHVKVLVTNYGGSVSNPITNIVGCSVDIFLYCTRGITPVAFLLISIVILAYLTLRILRTESSKIQTSTG